MQEIQYTPIGSNSTVNKRNIHQSRPKSSLERTPKRDSVDIKRKHQKEHDAKLRKQGVIIGAVAMLQALGIGKLALNQITPQEFDTMGNSIVEVADFCDVDPRAIALINGLEADEDVDKIIMPEKMDIENDLAEVYTYKGSKYAYIIPKEEGITAEELKEAFGIEDGVLRKYNDLSYSWGIDEDVEVHRGYRDYTGATIPYEGVRVPLSALE